MDVNHLHNLCDRCKTINFTAYFQNELNCHKDDRGFVSPTKEAECLGSFHDVFQRSASCNFCNLAVKAIHVGRNGMGITAEYMEARDDWLKTETKCWLFSYCFAINSPSEDEKAFRIGIATRMNDDETYHPECHQGDIQLLVEDLNHVSSGNLFHGRRVPPSFDMKLAQKWLSACENEHADLCEVSIGAGPPHELRVVDVQHMCVRYLPPGARYVALSYCWTKSSFKLTKANERALFRANALEHERKGLPLTIQDAIRCTAGLNESYIWIDSLCIIQDCDDDKRAQISQMDKVYGSAILTLVSAWSDSAFKSDPSRGFPRLRVSSGTTQEVMRVGEMTLAIPFPTVANVLESSRWDRRGWTFQECLLSKRRLYFTDTQVYFQCSCGVFCEDSIGEGSHCTAHISAASNLWNMGGQYGSGPNHIYYGTLLIRTTPYPSSRHALVDYNGLVMMYTDRELTHASDILNAFAGLEAVMTNTWSCDFWYGLPEAQLDRALLWTLTGKHQRRKVKIEGLGVDSLPSWAWAGWQSHVELVGYFHINALRSEVDWYLISRTGIAFPMLIAQEDDETLEFVKNTHADVRPTGSPPTDFRSNVQPRDKINIKDETWRFPKYLACWTTVTSFQLCGDTTSLGDHGRQWPTGRHLAIFDKNREWVGSIMMGQEWVKSNISGWRGFQFMLMSRSKEFSAREPEPPKVFFDEAVFARKPWCFVNVMLIERCDDAWTRLGVGLVHEHAWMAAKPQATLVKLI